MSTGLLVRVLAVGMSTGLLVRVLAVGMSTGLLVRVLTVGMSTGLLKRALAFVKAPQRLLCSSLCLQEKLCQFWFNTFFVDMHLEMQREQETQQKVCVLCPCDVCGGVVQVCARIRMCVVCEGVL